MTEKIFISIPSWRDPFIVQTIQSAYTRAYHPEDLVFGIVFQGYEEDRWMVHYIQNFAPLAEIRLMYVDAKTAPVNLCEIKGRLAMELFNDEKYYMQVDSHTKFRMNWDILIKAELKLANTLYGKAMLSQQILTFNSWDSPFNANTIVAHASEKEFIEIGSHFQEPLGLAMNGKMVHKPENMMMKEKFFNGSCFFAYKEYIKEVPQPSKMSIIYEQQMNMIRSWTAGYDVVSPSLQYTNGFNYWKTKPHFKDEESDEKDEYIRHNRLEDPLWRDKILEANRESRKLYNHIMENRIIDKDNGLFNERSYDEYRKFIQYDPITLKIDDDLRELDFRGSEHITNNMILNAAKVVADEDGHGILDIERIEI